MQAVDGVSFDLAPGEVLAIVGESGSGKSVTAQTIIGLTRSPNARIEGSVRAARRRADRGRRRRSCARSAASRSAMVFQDPMTSFNPVYRVGTQIVEAIRAHRREIGDKEARERAVEMLDSVGIPDAGPARRRLPARVLRRHAPAGDDRDGAGAGARRADRRRADDRARRHRPGADPRPARAAQPRARPGDDPDHPRPRRRRRGRRPGAGHVRRAGGRAGHARRDLLRPPAPLHLGPARLADPARPRRAPSACRRSAARRPRCSSLPQGCAFRPRCPHEFEPLPGAARPRARGSPRRRPTATAAGSRPRRSASAGRSRARSGWRRRRR